MQISETEKAQHQIIGNAQVIIRLMEELKTKAIVTGKQIGRAHV